MVAAATVPSVPATDMFTVEPEPPPGNEASTLHPAASRSVARSSSVTTKPGHLALSGDPPVRIEWVGAVEHGAQDGSHRHSAHRRRRGGGESPVAQVGLEGRPDDGPVPGQIGEGEPATPLRQVGDDLSSQVARVQGGGALFGDPPQGGGQTLNYHGLPGPRSRSPSKSARRDAGSVPNTDSPEYPR
jgi:hypothetical protein